MGRCGKVLFAVYLWRLTNSVNAQQTGFPIRGLEQPDAATTDAGSDDQEFAQRRSEELSGAASAVTVTPTTAAPTTQEATAAIVTTAAATTVIVTTQAATTAIVTTLPATTTVEATRAATTTIATTLSPTTTVKATQAATTTIATTLPPTTTVEATQAATTTIATTLPPTTTVKATQTATTTIATTLPPTTTVKATQTATTTIATTLPPTTTAEATQAATTTIVTTQGPTTTVTTALCFEDNTAWYPMDMAGTTESNEQDEYACQNKCASTLGCVHFTMGKQAADCHLQNAYASRQENAAAYVSGPFSCWEGIESMLGTQQQDFVDVGNYTYLEKAIACLKMGYVYTPIMVGGGPFLMDDSAHKEEAPGHAAIQQCEDKCSEVEGCTHFTVQFQEIVVSTKPLCRLAGANSHPTPLQGSVSGPRGGCSAADETEEKFDVSEGQLQTGWHRTAYGIAPGRDGASILAVAACIMVTLGAVGAYSARLLRRPRQATQLARQPKNAAGRLQEREALLTLELA